MGNNSRTKVLDFFGLHIRDPEEILDHFDVSYVPKKWRYFRKNSPSPRAYTSFKTLISNKNCSVTFDEISYVYVSKGSLSIGGIKLSGKVARGVCFSLREKLPPNLT